MTIATPLETAMVKRALELAQWLPRARTYTGGTDGLRSPTTDGQPGHTSGHTDPTAATALKAATNPHAAEVAAIGLEVANITTQLEQLLSRTHRLLPAPHANGTTTGGRPGCSSCHRAEAYVATEPGRSLCRWCRRWRDAHGGHLPALELVRDHLEGRYITTGRITELATAARRAKAKG